MIGEQRTCKSCGHDCHCYSPNCLQCINDVCGTCNCKEEEKSYNHQEHSDARSWDTYLK